MRISSEDGGINRLQEENRHLRSLLAESGAAVQIVASTLPSASPDYRACFEALPEVCAIFLPDAPRFTIAAVSDAYLRAVSRKQEEIVGRGVFEAFPDNPDDPHATGMTDVRASFEFVLRERAAHALPIYRYDVRRAESEGSAFEERYWATQNTPVFAPDGAVTYILHRTADVTARVRLEEKEKHSASQRQLALDAARMGWWHYDPVTQVAWWDGRYKEIFGIADSINDISEVMTRLHPDDVPAVWVAVEAALNPADPKPYGVEYRIRCPEGSIRWVEAHGLATFEETNGERRATSLIGTVVDITDRKLADAERERHVAEIEALNARLARAMQETHHRVKNNLQVISALVEMEEGSNGGNHAAHFRRIKQHTQALAIIHDILTAQAKGSAPDTAHVSGQMVMGRLIPILNAASGGRRIRAGVDNVPLPVQKSAALTLLVNELVSNALKHGQGEILITLRLAEGSPSCHERHACLEVCDDGQGFPIGFDPLQQANTGLELIESAARWDLRGEISYENRPEGGARIVVTFPIEAA